MDDRPESMIFASVAEAGAWPAESPAPDADEDELYGNGEADLEGSAEEEVGEVEIGEWEAMAVELEGFPSGTVLTPVSGTTGEGEEHFDPNHTGLPLYDTGPAVRDLKLSANFTVGELVRSGGQYADRARIAVQLVRCLQALRDKVGKPVRISSGYRSFARNNAVYHARGREPTRSQHCSGRAADVSIAGLSGMDIAKAAIDTCGGEIGVGIGRTYTHIDVRGTWRRWTYLDGEENRAAVAEIDSYRASRNRGAVPARTPDRVAGRVTLGVFTRCSTGEQPGARAIADQWRRSTGRKAGTFNCRLNEFGKHSLHGEGRSADLYARAGVATERAQADAYINWLLTNAVELQVAVVIWNGRIWSWSKRARGWRSYPGKDKHIDHIHVDLSWEGALHPSQMFTGAVPGL